MFAGLLKCMNNQKRLMINVGETIRKAPLFRRVLQSGESSQNEDLFV
jgi:hypothetical protein